MVRLPDSLEMTITVDWDVKPQNYNNITATMEKQNMVALLKMRAVLLKCGMSVADGYMTAQNRAATESLLSNGQIKLT